MQCGSPPELSDDQISAVLDGKADPDTQQHLEWCPGCALRVEHARRVETMLRSRLFRHDCPSAQTLTDLHFGMLGVTETDNTNSHISKCRHCQAYMAELRSFLNESRPDPKRRDWTPSTPRVRDLVARFLPPASQPVLRGRVPGLLMFEAGEVTIFLEREVINASAVLHGQIAVGEAAQLHWAHALVELWQAGKLQAVTTVDDTGDFRCQPLSHGPFALWITAPGGYKLVISEVEFQDE